MYVSNGDERMKVLTGIVLYNPNLTRLKENINAVICQSDMILCIDNGSDNIDNVQNIISEYPQIVLKKNEKNLGIATALHQMMCFAIANDYDWVLSLDQDSVCRSELMHEYNKYLGLEKVGILTCNILDRNFHSKAICEKNEKYRELKYCITSASLMNVKAYKTLAGYDEAMFIDGVDFDICVQMRKAGYRIIRINYDGVLHEVGHGKTVRFLGKECETYNHSPFRQYYMARNGFYLAMKYPEEFHLTKQILHEIKECYIICRYESSKMKKIKARLKGISDARRFYKEIKK